MTLEVKHARATVKAGEDDGTGPGTFDVILSTPTKDRDGEQVKADEWEQPLPDHVTFDIDHGMSVATTVGSGAPELQDDGTLRVRGTFASTPLAQETRTLVREGHIGTTSVAFLRKSGADTKSGTGTSRELLNGAFVAVPANPEARVLAAKAAAVKEGRRNAGDDAKRIQTIHDTASTLGASCSSSSGDDDAKRGPVRAAVTKAIAGSVEHLQERVHGAVQGAQESPSAFVMPHGIVPNDAGDGGQVVYSVYDFSSDEPPATYSQSYSDDGTTASLSDDRTPVDIVEQVVPRSTAQDGSAAADVTTAAASAAAVSTPAAADEVRARALAKSAELSAAALDLEEH